MDSLGMIAQQKEADAVLASFWSVNDLSTSWLMSDFYARWVHMPDAGKAEALRQAQLGFLHRDSPTIPMVHRWLRIWPIHFIGHPSSWSEILSESGPCYLL